MKKYYAIVRGYRPGIYNSWSGLYGAQTQIKGFPNHLYKGFSTIEDAERWYKEELNNLSSVGSAESTGSTGDSIPSSTISKKKISSLFNLIPIPSDVTIYSNGSALGNLGSGGYGVIIIQDGKEDRYSGGFERTTNNRMELMGCISGLDKLKEKSNVTIFTDSTYVVNGINKGWTTNWKKTGWKKNIEAENIDLWERLLTLCNQHDVKFHLINGHSDNDYKGLCDRMAKEAASGNNLQKDPGYKNAKMICPVKPEVDEVTWLWNLLSEA